MLTVGYRLSQAPDRASALIRNAKICVAYIICMPIFAANIQPKRAGTLIAGPDGVINRPQLTVSSPLRQKQGSQALRGGGYVLLLQCKMLIAPQ